ncbi:zinc-ribbon domain-containing protein [Planomonospora parontospora]|uniref:zinc-ribbon domain-containing protein n=1 Tax=Planomonospora parontospora TaxID=58119 RepID=UPI0019C31030|nr:zinc-ribbon domain-containing protein [Planomonospora parontospora]GGL51572.1 hypothetical protein GCM10014719_61110 [Planomonospora parontospora subsp. antibiotica]GII19617.1 hypothetical protein Ppa05_63430 [Planomonospora parontospora subsp. antibiotica]
MFTELLAVFEPILGTDAVRHHVNISELPSRAGPVDITITTKLRTIAIEFDGAYWHAPRLEHDCRKSRQLRKAGYHLIRVREHPLSSLHADDVEVPANVKPLEAAAATVRRMLERGWIEGTTYEAAKDYVEKGQLLGEELAREMLIHVAQRDLGDESLAITHPDMAAEWDEASNGELTPRQVNTKSSRKISWICGKGHRFEQKICDRVRGRGCPYCAGRRVDSENCLAAIRPELLLDWDYEKNSVTPYEITAGSQKQINWHCQRCGHDWTTPLKNRSRSKNPSGCPICARKSR